ncbi:glycosyl-transferase for dystroglycan-domain-containing protein [Naematelia encephala]|uniref:Glycosyl-transferase for dystroglycan-domain-containing protein n=1 Tax=Naematelia encephala TaxID=71784 RepID=A0A1Y2BFF1_9TREE|nr:glycosyl-transferase for dystroglycan-domain-containing protein [Naematelia encephala]
MLIQAAFGASIIPKETEVLPYFHQARKVPAKDDITIFTLLTLERGDMFQRLVAAHDGPISVTIHLLSRDLITEVEDLYSSHPLMAENVDLHLVISPHLREFNFYRNVARLFSRTNYVMQWDVDFARITDFRSRIRNDPALSGLLQKGNNAFVVPAFQYKRNEEPAKEKFPKTKEELLPLYRMGEGTIQMFYQHFPPGHGSSNYTKWVDADDIYIVEEWDHRYEPYVIFRRDTSPWCDTRFVGYGANKAACLFEMFISGINFWVMPHDFIMHQTHAYPEKARQIGFDYNRRLYDTYREEVCLRYLNYFAQSDDLETQRTENLYKECRKLSGFKKWEAQLVTE